MRLHITSLLLERGARLNPGDEPRVVIDLLIFLGNCQVLHAFPDAHGSFEILNGVGKVTPLHLAARSGSPEMIAFLEHRGAGLLNIVRSCPDSEASVEYITRLRAQIDLAGKSGKTPTIVAAREGKVRMLRQLIHLGADVNAQDQKGMAALMYAAWQRDEEAVEVLIDAGADCFITEERDLTPLYYIGSGALESLDKWLVEQGAAQHYIDRGWGIPALKRGAKLYLEGRPQWDYD